MSNVKKYIIFAIFLSFGFISNVFAERVLDVILPYGNTVEVDFSNYLDFSCSVGQTSKTKLTQVGDKYVVSWINNEDNSVGIDYYSCTFNYVIDLPYTEQPEDKNLTLKVHYGKMKSIINIALIKGRFESRNLLNDEVHGGTNWLHNIKQITAAYQGDDPSSGDRYKSGNKYTSIDCPAGQNTNCTISLKDDLPNDTSKRWALFGIEYEMNDGAEGYATIEVQIYSDAYAIAYAGDYGVCNFDSSWKVEDESYGVYKRILPGTTINMPSCDASNSANPLLDFKGWVNVSDLNEVPPNYMVSDLCAGEAKVLPGSNPYNPDKTIFIACYAGAEGILLMPNGGEVPILSNYTVDDDVIYVKQDGTVTLPEPTKIPSLYDMYGSARFEGWLDTNGVIHPAGSTVPADGERYMAMYGTGVTETGDEVNVKMIFVRETAVYKLNSTAIESCSSTDETKLTAVVSGGECMLTGVESTGTEYIDVLVDTIGSTRTLKVRVVNREIQENTDEWHNIVIGEDNTLNPDAKDGYFENVAGVKICNSYSVSNDGQLINDAAVYDDFGLDITRYKAVSKCEDDKEYLALCMDPGRPGPRKSDVYLIDESFTTKNEFGKLVYHIVQKFVNESETDTNIIAANMALRIIEYYSTEELASTSNGGNWYLKSALASYKALGNHLKDECPNLSECSENDVYDALGLWKWNNDEVRRQIAIYLTGFSGADIEEDGKVNNKSTRKGSYDESNNFLYHIQYTGTLTFPAGMAVSESDITADCGDVPGVLNCTVSGTFTSGSTYDYTFNYDIDLTETGFYIPETSDDVNPSIKINSNTGVTSANVFVIKTTKDNKQRMVIFNTSPTELEIYMPIYLVCDTNKDPFIIGGPGFRADLFKTAGCCQTITDETSVEWLTYCTADCIQTNFATVCNPNYVVGDNIGTDVYSIKESYKANGLGSKELNYACIVDVTANSDAIENTNAKTDANQHRYALNDYSENQYCSVSCKEDWDISTSSFGNFVGQRAVVAGQGFVLTHDMFIGGSRTCVTTYIDYDKYKTEMTNESKKLVEAWNTHSEYTKVYNTLVDSKSSTEETYYTYEVTGTYECGCDIDEVTGVKSNCSTCYTWAVKDTLTCTVYSISTAAGGQYQKGAWNGQNATNSTGNIATNALGGATGDGTELHTSWYVGSPPSSSSSTCTTCGYCKSEQNHEYLLSVATYNGNLITDVIDQQRSKITDAKSAITEKAEHMASCQNLNLINDSTENANPFNYADVATDVLAYGGNALVSGYLGTQKAVKITTKFEPTAEYEYEEKAFTELLGNDAVIVPHMDLNKSTIEAAGKDYDTFNNDCVELNRKNSEGENIKLCKNKLTTQTYNPGTPWIAGSWDAKNYGGVGTSFDSISVSKFQITICDYSGNSYLYDSHGNCDWDDGFVSYYPVNYIKQTLENSSYYRNKGSWFINNATDGKVHADDKEEAVRKMNLKWDDDKSSVAPFIAAINAFPVAMTTPRNMYQYTYWFNNIGYFADGTPGRLMSDSTTALIPVNRHACFYEVQESICRCCGDPIMWTTYESTLWDETEEFLDDNGYDYDMSDTSYDPSVPLNSHFAYKNSTVSLYDLAGSDYAYADNWSSHDIFTYDAKPYETDKGAVLASEIIKKGESIYDTGSNSPEYSYTLNPTAISLIKQYNERPIGYGYILEDLTTYGISNEMTAFDATITTINNSNENEIVTFSHYGSKFLENTLSSYITDEYKDSVLNIRTGQGSSNVCSVEAGPDAAKQAYNLINGEHKPCRWVDYIQTTPDGNKVRLAFK